MALPVDLGKVRQKTADIRDALNNLAPYAGVGPEEFLADPKGIAAAKFYLIVATEAAIGLCNHLAARVANRAPASYAECFGILRETGIISEQLAGRLVLMAKFRNFLIHRYADADDRVIHQIICQIPTDLTAYLSELGVFLKENI
ncbi:MAG: DUF86 domain-containing protein [Peptococcaceae bacterium]|nr:DUF86 domain-containing protein [Peptococcaceae bacterium]